MCLYVKWPRLPELSRQACMGRTVLLPYYCHMQPNSGKERTANYSRIQSAIKTMEVFSHTLYFGHKRNYLARTQLMTSIPSCSPTNGFTYRAALDWHCSNPKFVQNRQKCVKNNVSDLKTSTPSEPPALSIKNQQRAESKEQTASQPVPEKPVLACQRCWMNAVGWVS